MKIVNMNNKESTGMEYIKSVIAGFSGLLFMLLITPLMPLLGIYVLWMGLTGSLEFNPLTQFNQIKEDDEIR